MIEETTSGPDIYRDLDVGWNVDDHGLTDGWW